MIDPRSISPPVPVSLLGSNRLGSVLAVLLPGDDVVFKDPSLRVREHD